MILSKKRITKALIRLRECAGWSAPVLFANHRRQVFSRRGPIILRLCNPNNAFDKICLYGDLVNKKKLVSSNNVSAQFIEINYYKKIGNNINVLKQTAC